MKKEQEPALQFPDEAAIEERVRKMMDVSRPEKSASAALPAKKKSVTPKTTPDSEPDMPTQKTRSISVVEHDNEAVSLPSAPQLPSFNEEKNVKPSSPNKEVKNASAQTIVIKHFDDPGTPSSVEANKNETTSPIGGGKTELSSQKIKVLLDDTENTLSTVDNPLIPTEKLALTIKPKSAAKNKPDAKKVVLPSKKKSKIVAETATPVIDSDASEGDALPAIDTPSEETSPDKVEAPEPTPFTNIDNEIAGAFIDIEPDELDSLAHEAVDTPTLSEEETLTAPELLTEEKPVAEKPKFDKFKPLSTIRPQFPAPDVARRSLKLDDDATSHAVDEIVVSEADRLLEVPGGLLPKSVVKNRPLVHPKAAPQSQVVGQRRLLRRLITVTFVALLIALAALPLTRAAALNLVGVRSQASVTILDRSTGQPMQDVSVSADGKILKTDVNGEATLTGLKIGKTDLIVNRRAYAPQTLSFNLGWKPLNIPVISLSPTGMQHTLTIRDYVSGKPVAASLKSANGDARADSSGELKLTLDKSQSKPFQATLSATGYRSVQMNIDPTQQDLGKVNLVLARKYVYAVKSGTNADIYVSDLDGQNQKLILKGIASEQAKDIVLVPSSNDDQAVLVSNRNAGKTSNGTPLSTLTLLNLAKGSTSTIVSAGQIQIIGWFGERVVYTQILNTSKSTDPDRQQLISYDYKTQKSVTLAKANYFNNVLAAQGKVFYAPSSAYLASSNVGLFAVNADGSGKVTILALETWNIYRTSFDHLSLSVQQDWYDYKFGDKQANKLSSAPAALTNFMYIESADRRHGLLVDSANAQAGLNLYDATTHKERKLVSDNGVSYPVIWLSNNTFSYRINTSKETADYALSIYGGVPVKLHDVMNVSGITAWQVHL